MTPEFTHDTPAQRVRFAIGGAARNLAAETAARGFRRVLVVASSRDERRVAELCAGLPVVARLDSVVMHVPIEEVARARDIAIQSGADVLVSFGGGSATGLAKAIARDTSLPIIAIPTTFAASEATNMWGITDGGRKLTGRDAAVLPLTVIYDPELTESLPPEDVVSSGFNALAHGVDALWAPDRDPLNGALAVQAARMIIRSLPAAAESDVDGAARGRLSIGSYLAGVAFSSAGAGLHHKICHALGGRWRLPHAQLHAVMLPHVVGFNAPSGSDELREELGDIFGPGDPAARLFELARRLDTPSSLEGLGMPEGGIPEAAREISAVLPAGNPRAVSVGDVEDILRDAWKGRTGS